MLAESPALFDPFALSELRAEVARTKRMAELKKANGLDFYRPHHKQDLFHQADYKFRYLRTGNRFGKSDCGVAEDCAWARGERSWYKYEFDVLDGKGNITRHHPGGLDHPFITSGLPLRSTKGLIICADWDKAEEIFTNLEDGQARGKVFKMLPEGSWKYEKDHGEIKKIIVECIHGGESTIYIDTIKSFMTNKVGQESGDWDWIHIDEPCSEDQWTANARGLIDRKGRGWFTCTPLSELWINDFFLPPDEIRYSGHEPKLYADAKGRVNKWMLPGSSFDNPHISAEEVEINFGHLTEAEKETRILGRPKQLTGVIYTNFEPEAAILRGLPFGWTDILTPPDNACIRIAIDTHPKTPHAVLFAATMPNGQTVFWNEIFSHPDVKEFMELINSYVKGRNIAYCGCDLSAWNQDAKDGSSLADDMLTYAENLPIQKASKDLSRGILRTQQALRQRTDKGTPYLLFHESLKRTLFEFDRYVWDQKKEKPVDKNDHMMECLYRLVLAATDIMSPHPGIFTYISPEEQISAPAKFDGFNYSLGIPGRAEPSVQSFRDIIQNGQPVRTYRGKDRYKGDVSRDDGMDPEWTRQAARYTL